MRQIADMPCLHDDVPVGSLDVTHQFSVQNSPVEVRFSENSPEWHIVHQAAEGIAPDVLGKLRFEWISITGQM